MCAMAAPRPPRLDSVLSFGDGPAATAPTNDEADALAFSDEDEEEFEFEFAFAPPLARGDAEDALVPADDIFAHGRILPAYPVFDRRLLQRGRDDPAPTTPRDDQEASTAPPSPDTYCDWAPRSAWGQFPKSASTGEARRFWSLRGLVAGGAGRRSHSDGKEKFAFLQPASSSAAPPSRMSPPEGKQQASASAPTKPTNKQGKKKSTNAKVTQMDMATAHKLFYGKQGAGALAGDRRQQQQSYLPYRPGIVGFFTAAHALGRSHHPY